MCQWLNLNAGAIQGISAAVTAIVTVVLVFATWRYVHITSLLLENSERQFELARKQFYSASLPEMSLQVFFHNPPDRKLRYAFANVGKGLIRVDSLMFQIALPNGSFEHFNHDYSGVILPPTSSDKTPATIDFTIPEELWASITSNRSIQEMNRLLSIQVVVSDPAGLAKYECTHRVGRGYQVRIL